MIDDTTKKFLAEYASQYETVEFLDGDPSWFMHQVVGEANQETLAFVASCLSYGNRLQFLPKIQRLLDCSKGDFHHWVAGGGFLNCIKDNDDCFYRLYSNRTMRTFLMRLQTLLSEYGSIGHYVHSKASTGIEAVACLCDFFARDGGCAVVPKDTKSACKRVCMFLRWMVRDASPVDLGLWTDFIDKRTLIMPLDTHVVQQATRLALPLGRTVSMSSAQRLTEAMLEVFPDDPLKGDFALFGYGVNND